METAMTESDYMFDPDRRFLFSLSREIDAWLDEGTEDSPETRFFVRHAPDIFRLLCRLSFDPEVAPKERARLFWARVYFINSVDVLPEVAHGPAGYVDDVAVSAHVIDGVAREGSGDTLISRHWGGDGEIAEIISEILCGAERLLGKGRWDLLRRMPDEI